MRSAIRFSFLSLGLSLGMLHGQSKSGQVRDLNNQVLQLHGQLQQASADQAGAVRQQAAQVLASRAAALRTLIQENPGEALKLGFSQDLLSTLADAFPQ